MDRLEQPGGPISMSDDREELAIGDDVPETTIDGEPSMGTAPVEETAIEEPAPESLVVVPEVGPGVEQAIGRLGDRLSQQFDAIQALLERDARAEATRERVIDRLHGELQEYKQDLLLKVQRPIFLDLIQLHDDIGKMIDARPLPAADAEADPFAAVRGILESIQVAIEDILYRQGVEPFAAEGDAFDPRRQRAVATVATEDPARNKTIAARLRKGFQAGDKLIRPEIVSVYTFRSPSADPPA
jgi:molecular chaperone GrpE